ncbi:MAG: helix-turn-helix domain-containing protein [Rhizobacter sp.]
MRDVAMYRHEVFILLSAPGSGPFSIVTNEREYTLHAAAISPATRFVVNARGVHTIGIATNLVHPLYKPLRVHLDTPVRPLERSDFAHLDDDFRQAREGRLGLERVAEITREAMEIVLRDAPAVPPLDPRIAWIMRRMDADFNCTFDELAAGLKISSSRLSHLFSKELGTPFRSYIAWSRIVLAWEMVALRPDMSFTEIAHAWGFSDSSHLARAIHTSFGTTPTVMRDRRYVEIIGTPMPRGEHVPVDGEMLQPWRPKTQSETTEGSGDSSADDPTPA